MAFKLSRILTSRATRVEWSMDHLRSSILYSTIVVYLCEKFRQSQIV